ncbi:PIN domain-containing protein [Variovorax sp. Sphag1AA]|uniref:PIN domain-containing protein n=1 Tax=Variovorax sp. Sphag1AA TaxID=2587027 RepID=UPI0016184332|nr:PIN domain-containing protein [Variovorax sp. Sphag1AA]MBB3180279.1 putative nucleic acid-binding protein [Variovorax sp. Sphag1AA]
MAGASRYTALLDANVLFPKLQCDALLSLAHAGLYAAKWSVDIEREWLQARSAKFPDSDEANRTKARAMCEAIPDCMVEGYESFVECLQLPDPNDRHVLAAAIVGHADAIVTNNLSDFPIEALDKHCIDVQTPDQFIVNQLTLHPTQALSALRQMRMRWNNPAHTAETLAKLFEVRGMPLTSLHLLDRLDVL